jgi:hypothetical protein
MNPSERADPDFWDNDPVSQFITNHIQTMPDRPKVMLVIICEHMDLELPKIIARGMSEFGSAYLTALPLNILEINYTVFLFAFEIDGEERAGGMLHALATLPAFEGAVYVDGVARLRLAPTKRRAPEHGRK